jgi:hypothetical protein
MKRRLSYSNVIATLALFVSLGGASYAATTLPRSSVGTAQLRSGSVTGSKLAFPLGIATREAAGPVTLGAGFCPPQDPCPAQLATRLTSVSLTLSRPSSVLLLGGGVVQLATASSGAATVALGLGSGSGSPGTDVQSVDSTTATTFSLERVVASHAGRQTFSLTALASGVSESASVTGGSFQITAIVLPQAK